MTNGRIEGLEPTRTLGDFDIKNKVPPGVISIIPETRVVDIVDEGQKFDPQVAGSPHSGMLILEVIC